MEDQVPFKAFVSWNGHTKPEVRRFGVEKSVVTSFHYLIAKLQDVYPGLKNKNYTVAWKDDDGDDVIISSDEEIMIALGQLHSDVIKLYVNVADTMAEDTSAVKDEECDILLHAFPAATLIGARGDTAEHFGVTCDGCNSPVVGFRYKCASCPDYDLCSRCEAAGMHAAHCMVRIPLPAMPHAIIKAALKRSRHFLKTIPEECNTKKHKHDKGGKHHREEHHRERRDRRECRRQRGSWLETFASYMNEFANLAGDVDCHPPKDAPAEANVGPTPANQPGPSFNANQTHAPNQPEPSNVGNQSAPSNGSGNPPTPTIPKCPGMEQFFDPENIKKYMEMQKKLTDMFRANLTNPDLGNFAEMFAANINREPGNPSANQEPGTPSQSANQDAERASVESDKVSVTSGMSSGSEPKFADSTSDKGDDWTMINKENELMDVAGARPTAPQQAPIGFNLPQEFQQRVNITGGQNIYPPLNAATAVMDPKGQQPATAYAQPTPAQAQAIPTQVQPMPDQAQPTAAKAQPTAAQAPQPQMKPHIAKALETMLAMGFNNGSGWLTQLLENYDGNISAVIDLLTPVQSKKK